MAGGKKEQNTTSQAVNYDQRQVNTYDTTNYDLSDRSTTNTTTNSTTNADFSDRSTTNLWSDSSNRSVTTSTTNADFSDRSVTNTSSSSWADNSDRSTTTVYNTTTDGGAVAGALGVASGAVKSVADQFSALLGFTSGVVSGQNAATVHAYDYADNIFHGALDAVNANDARSLDAFNRAATMEKDALSMTRDGFSAALGTVQNAYADAKGTTQSQQKIMIGVLVVAAVAVLAPRLGK